jgi:hypothetical protein
MIYLSLFQHEDLPCEFLPRQGIYHALADSAASATALYFGLISSSDARSGSNEPTPHSPEMFTFLALIATITISQVQAFRPYSTWMADSAIARGQGHDYTWNYEHGTFWRALEGLYNYTGNPAYYDWIKCGADKVVSDSGSVGGYVKSENQLDTLRIGQALIFL